MWPLRIVMIPLLHQVKMKMTEEARRRVMLALQEGTTPLYLLHPHRHASWLRAQRYTLIVVIVSMNIVIVKVKTKMNLVIIKMKIKLVMKNSWTC